MLLWFRDCRFPEDENTLAKLKSEQNTSATVSYFGTVNFDRLKLNECQKQV